MTKHLRAFRRLFQIMAKVIGMAGKIMMQKPDKEDLYRVQEKLYNDVAAILGLTIVFNDKASPLETKRPVIYVGNHTSYGDPVIFGVTLRGTFAGKGEFLTWPLVNKMLQAVNYIGLRRSREYNPQSRAKIIKNFNEGHNLILFPEATIPAPEPERGVVTGDEVYRFHGGLLSVLFNDAGRDKQGNHATLKPAIARDICLQPVAIRVKEVNGQRAENDRIAHYDPNLRASYTGHNHKGMLAQIWQLLKTEKMTIEISPCHVLHPENFKDHFAMADEAHRQIAAIVAPHQKEAYFALLPGQDPAKRKPPVPMAAAAR